MTEAAPNKSHGSRALPRRLGLAAAGAVLFGLAQVPTAFAAASAQSVWLAWAAGLAVAGLSTGLALLCLRLWRTGRRLAAQNQLLQAEQARLRQAADNARQRSQHLLDHAGDAIFLIDPDSGALLEANRRAEELLGFAAAEIQSLSPGELFPGRHRRSFFLLVKRVLAEGYAEEPALLFRRRDGSRFIGAVHARLGTLGDRQVLHGVIRDVTALKKIEDELRQKNQGLLLLNDIAHRAAAAGPLPEMLSEVLAPVVAATKADGGGIYLVRHLGNELALSCHRGIESQLAQQLHLLGPDDGLLGRVAATGHPRSSADLANDRRVRYQPLASTGWRGIQAVPLLTDQAVIGVLFVFTRSRRLFTRDELRLLLAVGRQLGTAVKGAQIFDALNWQCRLTEASHRELERSRHELRQNLERLEEANQVLARLDRMKSHFLALASHELRTPLTYVLSGAQLLGESLAGRLSADEGKSLEAVWQGGKRLEAIVQDLLEIARIESRSLYLAHQPIDLPAIFSELVREFAPILDERLISLYLDDFPAAIELCGDAHHLKQTFRRLVENAVKFTPEGGRIEIRHQLTSTADLLLQQNRLSPFCPDFFLSPAARELLQVTIRDNGLGIPRQDHLRIFDKFYETGEISAHFTSQVRFGGKGVGLGLTLVKGMVEAHGGMVWVESDGPGGAARGSAFHVLLPLGTVTGGERWQPPGDSAAAAPVAEAP